MPRPLPLWTSHSPCWSTLRTSSIERCSTPDSVQTPEGEPINAAHGFFRMLARLVADLDPDYIACAADENWRPGWRVELIPSYKGFRAAPGSAQESAERRLATQVPILYGLLEMCDIPVIGYPDHEAEDVIGTLAQKAPGRFINHGGLNIWATFLRILEHFVQPFPSKRPPSGVDGPNPGGNWENPDTRISVLPVQVSAHSLALSILTSRSASHNLRNPCGVRQGGRRTCPSPCIT
ncbi:MAG: hypothetical protein GEU71_12790 [Actinobacteria bacterium]|nr:hypothetical protein [Actinomycetota bacterium]